jgi:hypothetical protein
MLFYPTVCMPVAVHEELPVWQHMRDVQLSQAFDVDIRKGLEMECCVEVG